MKDEWWHGVERSQMRPGLARITALLERLGHPERKYPVIHIAGTNGKGSVAAMVSQALMAQGYRVGLTTSPDLGHINERVMINRVPLDPLLWDQWGEEIEALGREMDEPPTFFEAVTGLAFLAFARLAVDIAVVEVGLGGRLDATNAVPPPLLSIITPIAYDHMDRLGHTIEAIAGEKAGIVKPGSRLVLAAQTYPTARETILAIARDRGVPVVEAVDSATTDSRGAVLEDPTWGEVRVPLLGAYQKNNLATAWTAILELHRLGWMPDLEKARTALAAVSWPGRFQVIRRQPYWVVDGAHNLHGIQGVVDTLRQPPWNRIRWHVVFAVLSDKPGEAMIKALLPHVYSVVLTRVPGDRGTDPDRLRAYVPPSFQPVVAEELTDAVRVAESRLTTAEDGVLVTGSLALLMHLARLGLWQDVPH